MLICCTYELQDIVSEHPERFFVAEIVREKIFMQYRDEVPYACQVCNLFLTIAFAYISSFLFLTFGVCILKLWFLISESFR